MRKICQLNQQIEPGIGHLRAHNADSYYSDLLISGSETMQQTDLEALCNQHAGFNRAFRAPFGARFLAVVRLLPPAIRLRRPSGRPESNEGSRLITNRIYKNSPTRRLFYILVGRVGLEPTTK